MKKGATNNRRRKSTSPVMTYRDKALKPWSTREDHRAWALRWDGAALSAVRGRQRARAPRT